MMIVLVLLLAVLGWHLWAQGFKLDKRLLSLIVQGAQATWDLAKKLGQLLVESLAMERIKRFMRTWFPSGEKSASDNGAGPNDARRTGNSALSIIIGLIAVLLVPIVYALLR